MPTGASSIAGGSSARARVGAAAVSSAGVDAARAASASLAAIAPRQGRVADSAAALARIAEAGSIWVYAPPEPTGQKVALMFSTIVQLRADSTVYFGGGGISTDEDDVLVAMPAGATLELDVTSSEEPGGGTYTITLRREKADTACVVTLTGAGDANRKGKSTASVPYSSMEWLSMRLASAGGAPDAIINVALKYQFAS